MKILVTGAGGQLGHDLIPRLKQAGFKGVYLDSKTLDITDKKKVIRTVVREQPDIIVNCAAYTKVDLAEEEPEKAFAVNTNGSAYLSEGAAQAGALLIHISTDFIFDGTKSSPYAEIDSPNPLSVYAGSKLAGEEKIIKRLSEYIIIRTSWLYGAHGQNFAKTILRLAGEREVLKVVSDQIGTPTWTGDLADALVMIAKNCRGGSVPTGIYHFADEGVASRYDFAYAIIEEARVSGTQFVCKVLEPIMTSEYPTPARRPAYSVLDKQKIKRRFGLSIPHWRTSLRKMLRQLYGEPNA